MNDIERYGLPSERCGCSSSGYGGARGKGQYRRAAAVLRKRKATILGLTAGTFALTAALTLLQHPIYEAKTQLLVQLNKQPGLGGEKDCRCSAR